jgi:hypothetical protein
MFFSRNVVLAFVTLACSVNAIKITSPSNTTGWTTTGSQVIEWDVSPLALPLYALTHNLASLSCALYPSRYPTSTQFLFRLLIFLLTHRFTSHPQSVNTDPSNFTIQLILPSSPNDPKTLANQIETSSGSYTYTPDSNLDAGNQYRVNFVSSSNNGILAQSDYFEVKAGES